LSPCLAGAAGSSILTDLTFGSSAAGEQSSYAGRHYTRPGRAVIEINPNAKVEQSLRKMSAAPLPILFLTLLTREKKGSRKQVIGCDSTFTNNAARAVRAPLCLCFVTVTII
jgi:hypothetical protein